MQFSLRRFFAVTTIVAVGFYSLIYATPLWAEVWFTGCFVTLLAATLFAAASSAGQRRWYWAGFALFGWAYWIVLHSPILDMEPESPNWRLNPESPPPFITTRILGFVYTSVVPLAHRLPANDPMVATGTIYTDERDVFGYAVRRWSYPTEIEFLRVGHSQAALLFAVLGGALGTLAYRRGKPSS